MLHGCDFLTHFDSIALHLHVHTAQSPSIAHPWPLHYHRHYHCHQRFVVPKSFHLVLSLISSRFYENIRTMFSTLVRIWFLHVSKVFFFWGASRHLWQRFCVAVFDLALQGWHTVTLTHTPRRHKRHRILHKTTRQAWLKKCKKIREDTTNVWILVMLYFTWIWFFEYFDVCSLSMGLFGQFTTIMSLSFCFYRLNR